MEIQQSNREKDKTVFLMLNMMFNHRSLKHINLTQELHCFSPSDKMLLLALYSKTVSDLQECVDTQRGKTSISLSGFLMSLPGKCASSTPNVHGSPL